MTNPGYPDTHYRDAMDNGVTCTALLDVGWAPGESPVCIRDQGHPGMHLNADGTNWTDDFNVDQGDGSLP